MAVIKLGLRRLVRHWRVNLLLLAGLAFGAGLLAALPSYADTTAAAALEDALQKASISARNLQVSGAEAEMTPRNYSIVTENLGDLIQGSMEVRLAVLPAEAQLDKQVIAVDETPRLPMNFIAPWYFEHRDEKLELLEGKWPAAGGEPPPEHLFDPPTFQAAITPEIAAATGLKIDDRLVAQGGTEFRIVGLYQRRDPQDPIWWNDERAFELWFEPGLNEDTYFVSLLLARGDVSAFGSFQMNWRILVDSSRITPDNAVQVGERLINMKTRLAASGLSLDSILPDLLQRYRGDLERVRVVIFLLSAQSFAFVLYSLAVLAGYANRLSESEIFTLGGRGASSWTIVLTFAVERVFLLAGALLLGPLLASAFLRLWSASTGEAIPAGLPLESYLLALLGAGLGWLALVLPVIPAARRSWQEFQRLKARPAQQTAWQRRFLDIFLLILGGLAYWQLGTSGGFLLASLRGVDGSGQIDPLLLIGPTLLLIALSLLFLRIFPYLLRFFAWLAQRTRGLVLKLGLARLARDPVQPSQMLLLITMAVGLTLFAVGFGESIEKAQQEVALYLSGADLRVLQWRDTVEQVAALPGVQEAAPVFRGQVLRKENNLNLTLLAVDTATLDQVSAYPAGMSNVSISQILRVLSPPGFDPVQAASTPTPTPGEEKYGRNPYLQPRTTYNPEFTLPAVLSYDAVPAGVEIGDTVVLEFQGQEFQVELRGIIANFPTVRNRYVLINREQLQQFVDLQAERSLRSRELWLKVDPGQATALERHFSEEDRLLASYFEQVENLTSSALAWGTQRAFGLNAAVLVLLSVSGFLLISFFNARQRSYEFGVLRAGGLSTRQLLGLLSGEGLVVVVLGFSAGSLVGYGLLNLMRFYLSQVLREVLPGLEVRQLLMSPQSIAAVYGLLLVFFGLALLLLLISLLRTGIQRTLRLGEE